MSGPTKVAGWCLAAALVVEGASWGVSRFRHGVGYRAMGAVKAAAARAGEAAPSRDEIARELAAPLAGAWTIHPYFGFVPSAMAGLDGEPVHRAGFTVGVFGGTAAAALHEQGPAGEFAGTIEAALPHAGRVSVAGIAVAGWRQAQPTMALLYHLDAVDAAVIVEAVDDFTAAAEDIEGYPPDFPEPAIYLPLAAAPFRSHTAIHQLDLIEAREAQRRAASIASTWPFSSSMAVHLAWRAYQMRLHRQVAAARDGLREAHDGPRFTARAPQNVDAAATRDERLRRHATRLVACHRAAAARGKILVHVVVAAEGRGQDAARLSSELRQHGVPSHLLTVSSAPDGCLLARQVGAALLAAGATPPSAPARRPAPGSP